MAGKKHELEVEGRKIAISNPEKILYPAAGFTKAGVIDYYVRVSEWLLPHLRDRPVTLKRYPNGIHGEHFYEKDAPGFTPGWVQRFPVPRRAGGTDICYILINDLPTLVWSANLANLEIHPFLHRAPQIDCPTMVVFDLDPGEGTDILDCAEIAFYIKEVLDRLGLEAFPKVSGSKGLQLSIPLNTPTTYEITQPFARGMAQLIEREHPDRAVSEMSKERRKGKVFIDWSQNSDFKTTVGVYSLRAKREQPYISMPVTWDELKKARKRESLDFEVEAALKRLAKIGDLYAPVLTLKQKLTGAVPTAAPTPKRPRSANPADPNRSRQGSRRPFSIRGTTLQLDQTTLTLDSAPGDDSGAFELMEGSTRQKKLQIFFEGEKHRGEWTLVRDGHAWRVEGGTDESWLTFIEPMQAKLTTEVPEGSGWLYEIKFDGYRTLAMKKSGEITLFSRRGNRLNSRFGKIATAFEPLPDGTMIDGEVIALDDQGRPSFNVLQNQRTTSLPIFYYAFDLLAWRGENLLDKPLTTRRNKLRQAMGGLADPIRISETLLASPRELIAAAREQGLEGVVAKRANSRYEPGRRSGAWVKFKVNRGQELVIGGYLPGPQRFGALLAGYYDPKGRLIFIGKIKNGFVPRTREEVFRRFRGLETDVCPFANLPEPKNARRGKAITAEVMRECRWLKPELVAQVEFTEWTAADHLRHSRFVALRDDKDPQEVVKEF